MEKVVGSDWTAARLLAGFSLKDWSKVTGLSHDTLQRLEQGHRIRPAAQDAVVRALTAYGIMIDGGFVDHTSGRRAPTIYAVGRFHGVRIRRARWRLRMTIEGMASRTGLSVATIRKLESAQELNKRPTLGFYKVVGVLQLEGIVFGPQRHGGRDGDRSIVPRPLKEPVEVTESRIILRRIRQNLAILEGWHAEMIGPQLTKAGELSKQGRVPRAPRQSSGRGEFEAEFARAMEEDEL